MMQKDEKKEKKRLMWRFILKGQCDFIHEEQKTARFFIELAWAFVVAMIIRSFLIQPFIIPTGSMIPTILIGDFVFVNKTAYGYTKHSFPLQMIPFEGRIFAKDPEVGDVICFNNPKDEGKDYTKRCVAKAGDRVQMKGGKLNINGKELALEFVKKIPHTNSRGKTLIVEEYIETLPNGVKHPIYKESFGGHTFDETEELVVPEDHFFGMGDNRDDSADSRCEQILGFIPGKNLIGKIVLRWMSIEGARWWAVWEWPWTIRYSRIGTLVH
ncbi:MAG: signal peptidase I [Proteobacteria bacterium]|nr:signal peptidase I [Pseudomonadota bacterium]